MEQLSNIATGITEGLTKFELLELYHMQRSTITEEIAIFMTILFGYVAASYFVGGKLKKSQSAAISILYTVFAWLMIWGIMITTISTSATNHALTGVEVSLFWVTPALLFATWVYSIWFHVQVRKVNDA